MKIAQKITHGYEYDSEQFDVFLINMTFLRVKNKDVALVSYNNAGKCGKKRFPCLHIMLPSVQQLYNLFVANYATYTNGFNVTALS